MDITSGTAIVYFAVAFGVFCAIVVKEHLKEMKTSFKYQKGMAVRTKAMPTFDNDTPAKKVHILLVKGKTFFPPMYQVKDMESGRLSNLPKDYVERNYERAYLADG